ncbi:MAG: DegV family protein [Lachnospiraceae bacterium]|nr:DegV family protein [Lachnospiraceae bacterium]
MSVRIVTDSGADVSQELAKEWNITVIPLTVRFGEEEYYDGVTMMPEDFYEKLIETDEFPKTSQISPYRYEEVFDEALEAGDEVVCLTVSSDLSGCYQSACIAADDRDGIWVLDSRQVCVGEFIQVQRAVQLRDAGYSAADIAKTLKQDVDRVRIIAVFDTLEYLKKGGRISATAATLGSMLAIKPVISIINGVVEVLGKARGSKNGNNMLREYIHKEGGIHWEDPVCLAYSGLSDVMLKKYMQDSAELYDGHEEDLRITHVGATIGTYAGDGAIAVAFYVK